MEIQDHLNAIRSNICEAAAKSGRPANAITLLAVSKAQPPEAIQEVIDAGHLLFGESRVQEAKAKIPMLPSKARWHFIGHLQSNKIRQALPLFERLHSIDSLSLAKDVNRIAGELGLYPKILLEVNLAGESSKFGFRPEKLRAELEELLSLDRLQIDGVMTIPPLAPRPEDSRKYFSGLRTLRDELEKEFRIGLPELSMGMSGDYQVAIQEGATIVRVGTALFGERKGQ